ncbi:hypothetical protein JQC67_05525 [Aurantibacter crassamenti]|uniref:hypothetical protein n=1 Tax=Aurantibacter crassamenti TaxID=1837375 RepID=UPI001939A3E8|nr:hypothetical protein [Aurantibacter crassamenti]MBM1105597.1 hypothetical protein [Aurantibacter crassamenti]
MKLTLLFSSILVLSFLGCKSQQYTFEELPEKQLIFGSGGGMTGAVDSYWLLENGQIFHSNSLTKEVNKLESISRKEAKTYFLKLKELSFADLDFNHPGNHYYFLEEVNLDNSYKIVWGSNNHEISDEYLDFHNQLKELIK